MKIDTSTTSGKIQVMQARDDGKVIESIKLDIENGWKVTDYPAWNWFQYVYRIKPQTVAEAAKIYAATPKATLVNQSEYDFEQGAQWQKEQDNE